MLILVDLLSLRHAFYRLVPLKLNFINLAFIYAIIAHDEKTKKLRDGLFFVYLWSIGNMLQRNGQFMRSFLQTLSDKIPEKLLPNLFSFSKLKFMLI